MMSAQVWWLEATTAHAFSIRKFDRHFGCEPCDVQKANRADVHGHEAGDHCVHPSVQDGLHEGERRYELRQTDDIEC